MIGSTPERMSSILESPDSVNFIEDKIAAANFPGGLGYLLEAGATPAGRRSLAQLLGCTEAEIVEAIGLADFLRLSWMGSQSAALLLQAGIRDSRQLGASDATELHARLQEVCAKTEPLRILPSPIMVEHWIRESRSLPAIDLA